MSRYIFIRPCWSCGAKDRACYRRCKCAKCLNPRGYAEWKNGNPHEYRNWLYGQRRYRKSKFIPSKEFEGDGKVLIFNSNKEKLNSDGEYGEVVEYEVKELSGTNRIITANAISLIRGIHNKLKEKPKGTDVKLHVRKSGAGMQPYIVEDVSD